ncbi:MAG: MFS transporter [Abitibacteriaceae bacterium]|nr:MFS transporter [Abditibacteriaceae bacterium]
MRAIVRVLLSVMMFIEYAVWGAWMPILSATLINRGIQPQDVGNTYAALWLACIISPFIGGQLVDRFMPSQIFLAVSHLLAAGAAFMMATQTTAHGFMLWMFIWSLLFAPSLGITNSIAFFHIEKVEKDEARRERDFSWIRTAGTIGWIVAGFVLTGYMLLTHAADPKGLHGPIPEMQLAGILGVIMAIFSLFLPHTPPAKDQRVDPFAFRRAFTLFKSVPGFTVFMAISFIAATEFQFFYVLSGQYLESLTVPHTYIPIVKSISQIAEIAALALLLPLWLPSKGMRWCLLLGSFAWPLRYIIFAIGKPIELVIASLALHGFGYAFVLVVQQLYVDRVSPKDIRGSAQSLLTFVTLGIGNLLGSIFCGMVQQHYTVAGKTNWPPVFILPAVTTLVCAVAYMLTFRAPTVEDEHIGTASLEVAPAEAL